MEVYASERTNRIANPTSVTVANGEDLPRTCEEITLPRAIPANYDIVFRGERIDFCLVSVCDES